MTDGSLYKYVKIEYNNTLYISILEYDNECDYIYILYKVYIYKSVYICIVYIWNHQPHSIDLG